MADARYVTGLDKLDAFLKQLPARVEGNVVRGGIRAGVRVYTLAARANVSVKSGKLRKSIRYSVRIKNGKVLGTVTAGSKDAIYAQMVEFGTIRHLIKPKNREALAFAGAVRETVEHPGAVAKPFMRPALDGSTDEAIKAVAEYIRRRLPLEMLKHVGAR